HSSPCEHTPATDVFSLSLHDALPISRSGCSATMRRPRAMRSSSACRGTRWSSGGAGSSWSASRACTCTAPGTWELRCEARGGASVPRKSSGGGQDRDRRYRHVHQGEDAMTVDKVICIV